MGKCNGINSVGAIGSVGNQFEITHIPASTLSTACVTTIKHDKQTTHNNSTAPAHLLRTIMDGWVQGAFFQAAAMMVLVVPPRHPTVPSKRKARKHDDSELPFVCNRFRGPDARGQPVVAVREWKPHGCSSLSCTCPACTVAHSRTALVPWTATQNRRWQLPPGEKCGQAARSRTVEAPHCRT